MSADTDRLREMIDDAPEQSDNLANSISDVTDIRDDYNDQISAVQNGMCAVAEDDLVTYLEDTKLQEITGDSTSPTRVDYGANFGTINYTTGGITDWAIQEFQGVTWTDIYVYEGIGWDGDSTIAGLIDDYAFGNDYLTRPLNTGATYGLIPYRDNLNTAITILTNNKNKVDSSVTYLEDYAT